MACSCIIRRNQIEPKGRIFFTYKMFNKYSILSNEHPTRLFVFGRFFNCVEQSFFYQKMLHNGCSERSINDLMNCRNGQEARLLGTQVHTINYNWETHTRLNVMFTILNTRFYQDKNFQNVLLATGRHELHEILSSNFWGYGMGLGKSHTGKMLCQIRDNHYKSVEDGSICSN